jgi:endonuclease/exonuclease/phosphatase (EEP) superfamily protein YafD
MLGPVRKIASGVSMLCGVLLLLTALILPFRAIDPQLDLLSPLVPFVFWSATSLVLVKGLSRAVLARKRAPKIGFLMAGAACAISAVTYLPERLGGPTVQTGSTDGDGCLVVLTANLSPNTSAIEPFIELVENVKPDILMLQEVYEWHVALRRALTSYRFAAGCEDKSLCNAVILTRGPTVVRKAWVMDGFVAAKIQIDGIKSDDGLLWAASVHLSRGLPAQQTLQIETLASLIGQGSNATIVAGDFNLVPWSGLMIGLERKLSLTRWTRDFPTWPTRSWLRAKSGFPYGVPLFGIDHILAGAYWAVVAQPDGYDFGSDHNAVVTTMCPRS